MKSLIVTTCVLVTLLFSSCHRKGNISIRVRESDHFYSMQAYFDEAKTTQVQEYMTTRIGDRNHFSFVNTQTDAMITLDDHTRFYIKSYPGELKIKLDKRENDYDAYTRVKTMCEGLKQVIGE